ncbi:MAG: GTP-binding protein [Planctomycetota bacterium]
MSQTPRARYVMIGGFLGAGKTTAVGRFARRLHESGQQVGLITNDQSIGLVDTTILRGQGWAVEEIAGGCFCCRFPSLQEAAAKLQQSVRPDIFLAEPVGSCTDLVATVSYPLRRIYGDDFAIAPLSVLIDPARAERVLGLSDQGRAFSEKVVYVYRKQLEEADAIVINKIDQLDPERRGALLEALGREYPRARLFEVSAKEGEGLDAWFEWLEGAETAMAPTMQLDYDTYAEGEALLGWMNATWEITGGAPFNANELLVSLARAMQEQCRFADMEIAHLKMTLDSPDAGGQLSVVSVTSGDDEHPDLRESLLDEVSGGALIVNLRAEGDPEELRAIGTRAVERAVAVQGLEARSEHVEYFRPARPVPTHRDIVTEEASG